MSDAAELAKSVLASEEGEGAWVSSSFLSRLKAFLEETASSLHNEAREARTLEEPGQHLSDALEALGSIYSAAKALSGKSAAKRWIIQQTQDGHIRSALVSVENAIDGLPREDPHELFDIDPTQLEELIRDLEWALR